MLEFICSRLMEEGRRICFSGLNIPSLKLKMYLVEIISKFSCIEQTHQHFHNSLLLTMFLSEVMIVGIETVAMDTDKSILVCCLSSPLVFSVWSVFFSLLQDCYFYVGQQSMGHMQLSLLQCPVTW